MKTGRLSNVLTLLGLLAVSCGGGNTTRLADNSADDDIAVVTLAVTDIAGNTATTGGDISAGDEVTIIARGVCWSQSRIPSLDDMCTTDGSGPGTFTSNITQLTPSTQYYVRAYATSEAGTGYGREVVFTTLGADAQVPTLSTTGITSITQISARSGGNISAEGSSPVTARGICWATVPSPTINDSKTTDATGIGSFDSIMNGLSYNTTYYVRAYATNANGTGYGNQLNFTTLATIEPPVVTTGAATEVAAEGVTLAGTVSGSGSASVTTCGICVSLTPNPVYSVSSSACPAADMVAESFTVSYTLLQPMTMYYFRAYARTGDGAVYYGLEDTFTTPKALPTVKTLPLASEEAREIRRAVIGGELVTLAASVSYPVTRYGFCWNTGKDTDPNLVDDLWQDSTDTIVQGGTTSFLRVLYPISAATTYKFRAFVVSNGVTVYGDTLSFTTRSVYVPQTSTVTDVNDDIVYKTVRLNGVWWMAENLRSTIYVGGGTVPYITDTASWAAMGSYAYTYYNSDGGNDPIYGKLYNRMTLPQDNLCPTAEWTYPTVADWVGVLQYLYGSTSGSSLMEGTDAHWSLSMGSNPLLFTALPGGSRDETGAYDNGGVLGDDGYWWTTDAGADADHYIAIRLHVTDAVTQVSLHKNSGVSLRCIKRDSP